MAESEAVYHSGKTYDETDSDSDSDSDSEGRRKKITVREQRSDRSAGIQSISILEHTTKSSSAKKKKTVYYVINVKIDGDGHVVLKRYKQFEKLHNKLCKRYNHKLPHFPVKKVKAFTNHNGSYFVEKRRALLDNYCKKLLQNRQTQQSQEVIQFFSEDKDSNREFQYEVIPAFPREQEVTDISIPKYRKMTDHILYTLDVTNEHTGSNWIVLKRFTQFRDMDKKLRKILPEEIKERLPKRPKRKSKVWRDHMNPEFIEERRVMMENYLRRVLCVPQVAHSEQFLKFLGVGSEAAV